MGSPITQPFAACGAVDSGQVTRPVYTPFSSRPGPARPQSSLMPSARGQIQVTGHRRHQRGIVQYLTR